MTEQPNTSDKKNGWNRRDTLKILGISALAGGATYGAGTYIASTVKPSNTATGEAINNPSLEKKEEIWQANASHAEITPVAEQPQTPLPTTETVELAGSEYDKPENLPEDTTPGLGEQPKNIDWNSIKPLTLRISEVGFNANLQYVGDTYIPSRGVSEINIPASYLIGVYSDSAPLSSKTGTTLLVGHVNWDNGAAAPMSSIMAAKHGHHVYTTDESGALTEWTVTRIEPWVPQSELSNWWNVTDKTGSRKLIMATCHGSVTNGRWTYTHNFVVVAEPK